MGGDMKIAYTRVSINMHKEKNIANELRETKVNNVLPSS